MCRRGRCRSARISRGGRSPVTRAPVSRCPRSSGKARRRSGRRASTRAIRRPSSTRSSPRTVVSTSGSSGIRVIARYGEAIGAKPARGAQPYADKVNFGDELVSPEEKTRRVGAVFSSVARRYDADERPDVGRHAPAVEGPLRRSGEAARRRAILDMAGGTGDIAFRMARRGAQVTVADINADMLEVGKERAETARPRRTGVEGRECRGAELRAMQLRRVYDRLWYPERHRHSGSACVRRTAC